MTQTQWRIRRQSSGTVDSDLYDVEITESFNRQASHATAWVADPNRNKLADYPRGQRVEFEYSTDGGSTWTQRFAAAVNNQVETTSNGLTSLKLDCSGYDFYLRRRQVYETYSSSKLSAILKKLITNYTPVKWVASNVTVVNDKTITREFKGETVDTAIEEIARESADEEYYVNDAFEFVFEPQSESTAPKLTERSIFDYSFPTEGKQSINRYRLFYGEGSSKSSVIVEDREAQRELKSKLGAPRRVVISQSDTMPEISSESRAQAIASSRMADRSPIQTGTVQTFKRFGTNAGDVFTLTHPEAGIDEDFRVAQVEYRWREARTTLTVAEATAANIEDLLVALSDSVQNVRARAADPTASFTRFLDFTSGVTLDSTAEIVQDTLATDQFLGGFSRSVAGFQRADLPGFRIASRSRTAQDSEAVTKAFINAARDVWQGEAAPGVSHVGLGTNSEAATTADAALGSEVLRLALDEFGDEGSTGLHAGSARLPAGGPHAGTAFSELGLFDAASGGTLYERATTADVTHATDTIEFVDVDISIANDGQQQGVVTSTGQTRLRDLLLGDTGHEPTDMVLGTGTTDAATSDTALANKLIEQALDSTADTKLGVSDVIMRLATSEGNGNTYSEVGEENASNELLTRLVFEGLDKTSSFALETNHRFKARDV